MKKSQIVGILIVLAIIMIVIITILLLVNKPKGEVQLATPETKIDSIEIDKKIAEVSTRNDYYVVKNCINNFYMNYNNIYNSENDFLILDEDTKKSIELIKKKNIESVYNILAEEYKQYKKITIENLDEKLTPIDISEITINNMYVAKRDENISIYFVNGYLLNSSRSKTQEFSIIVNVDIKNKTYSICLDDYVENKYKSIKVGDELNINYIENIKSNKENTFIFKIIDDETHILEIFNNFKNNILYNKRIVYNQLDKDYKEKRFSTYEKFEEYINSRIKDNVIMKLVKYQKSKQGEYTQYIIQDQYKRMYIFNEKGIMNLSIMLDTYTIDLQKFIEKYNSSNDQIKVGMNIEKVLQAIDLNDYDYVYNKLDKTFRNKTFKNMDSMKNYLEKNLYKEIDIKYNKFTKQGNTYIYELKVTQKNNKESKKKTLTIIMKLLDSTDFVMSFNIK